MSLQNAAKYLAKNGRGKDTMLVHMTPKEVGSLQALARANGGSLSVNPHTGLPEAGFLDSLLPVIIGGGLMAATGGAAAPLIGGMSMPAAIGLGVGGIQALRTGDIGKGITAGLGAYGGAGLGAGLLGAGSAATAAEMAGGLSGASAGELAAAQQGAAQAAQQATALERLSSMGSGIEGLGSEAGRAGFMNAVGGGTGLAKAGLAAAAPFVSDANQFEMPQSKGSGPNPFKYRYEPNVTSPFPIPDVPGYGDQGRNFGREQRYYSGQYVPVMAGGGPVEAMSNANAVGANTGYPMANIRHGAYATPYQQPISQNVVTGDQDTRVDPYTGEERLAGGGVAEQNPLLESPYFPGRYEAGASDTAPAPAPSSPGQGISSGLTDFGLGLMGLAESAPGLATGIAGSIGSGIAGQQADAMGQAQSAMEGMNATPGIVAISDTNGNVIGVVTNDSISVADAAFGDAASAAASGVGPGGAPGGAGGDGGTGDAGSAVGDGGASASGGDGGGSGEANGGLLRRKYAMGGLSDLGGYSDGGRLLRGPGDGVSDSIPAVIGKRQPARLADGEFVVPARIVSELGNGSTEAGARKLYAMMDRVQKARGKTTGKGNIAKNTRADKHLPA